MGLTIGFAGLTSRIALCDRRLPLAALFLDSAIDGRLLAIGYGAAVAPPGNVRDRQKGDEQQDAARYGDDASTAQSRMALARARCWRRSWRPFNPPLIRRVTPSTSSRSAAALIRRDVQ